MTLRRTAPLLVALLACQAELDRRPLRPVEYAVFDPSSSLIPLPNDLALASAPGLPDGAQKELLLAWAAAGGFPSDQEVPLTIDFTRAVVDPENGAISYEAPDLDLASLSATTVVAMRVAGATPAPVPLDLANATYVKGETRGTLTIRRAVNPATGKRNWEGGGTHVVAVRGGRDGVRVLGASHPEGLQPQPTFYVLREAALADKDLTDPHNQGLLPGTKAEKAAAGAQLEQIRLQYQAPLALIDAAAFPASEVALLQTFAVEGGTSVPVDAGSATLPLPIDLLRDPTTGKIVNNPAFGPAAAGLATLDGFSTTGMILAPTTGPIDAGTVNGATIALYQLNGAAAPVKLADLGSALVAGAPQTARYVAEPAPITQACPGVGSGACSTVIGLAPAVPAPVPGVDTFYLPPLDEATEYAVVVTDGVKDVTGAALKRSTFAKILLDVASPVYVDGKSQLVGVSDEIAGQIALMKAKLAPVIGAVEDPSKVVMAWTFRTQSITGTSVALSAAAYAPALAALMVPGAPTANATLNAMLPPEVAGFYDVPVTTLDAIDPTTGALNPDQGAWAPAQIPALVAIPDAANVPLCPNSATAKCAPLAVVHHGLGGSRYSMAAIAPRLAREGYVVVAIDAPYHGHRAFCTENAECENPDGTDGVCTPDAAKAGQGDAIPPGTCTGGSSLRFSLASGTTAASGNYFISANFFRTRDAIRQDLLDHGALTLAFAPLAEPGNSRPDAFTALLASHGIAGVHAGRVHYAGVSLGGIIGTNVVATNPRFSNAVLSVAGGTLVDVFTNAPAFADSVDALFLSLGIDRNDPADAAAYLKTLNVAKWILDPADPVNFARHLALAPLPNPIAGGAPQPAKNVLGQVAKCDPVVPNLYNGLLFHVGDVFHTQFESATAANACVSHSAPFTSAAGQDQIATYLTDPAAEQPAVITLP